MNTTLLDALRRLTTATLTGHPVMLTADECHALQLYMDALLAEIDGLPQAEITEHRIDLHLN